MDNTTDPIPTLPDTQADQPSQDKRERDNRSGRALGVVAIIIALLAGGGAVGALVAGHGDVNVISTEQPVVKTSLLHAYAVAETEGSSFSVVIDLTARAPMSSAARVDIDAAMAAARASLETAGITADMIDVEGPHLGDDGTATVWVTLVADLSSTELDAEGASTLSSNVADAVRASAGGRVEAAVSVSRRIADASEGADGAYDQAVTKAVAKLAEREGVKPEDVQVVDVEVLSSRSDDASAQVTVQITAVVDKADITA